MHVRDLADLHLHKFLASTSYIEQIPGFASLPRDRSPIARLAWRGEPERRIAAAGDEVKLSTGAADCEHEQHKAKQAIFVMRQPAMPHLLSTDSRIN